MRIDFSRHLRACLAACATLALAACAVGPDYHRSAAPSASRYAPEATPDTTAAAPVQGGAAQRLVAAMDIPGQWWMLLRSEPLNALIDDALRHNADVQAAQAALEAAWENVRAQRGAYFPQMVAGYDATRTDVAGDVASSAQSGASLYSLATAQVSVSYAPDLWGGNRRQVEALVAGANAQRFQLEATYLSLTCNLVNAAIAEASLRAQIDTTREIIEAQAKILAILRHRQALGDVAEAAVATQLTALEQSRAGLPSLQKQLAQQRDLLAALSGRTPDAGIDARFSLDDLQLPAELPLSLPASLLDRRPDVRAAEEQLHAASANVGVAIAARLPDVQINASFGRASQKASGLFGADAGFWNLGAGLTQPLFDGGALRHKQRAAEALYRQAAAQYRGTVLAAVQDMADVLHAVQADAQALVAARRAEQAAARNLQIARRQLALGDIGESALLDAQIAYQQTAIALVQARAARYSDTVALFQAAGGGWWHRGDMQAGAR